MSQRKPDGEHTGGRRKSENRKRQRIVAVRFSDAEYETLAAAMTSSGLSAGRVLRETFLVAEFNHLLPELLGPWEEAS